LRNRSNLNFRRFNIGGNNWENTANWNSKPLGIYANVDYFLVEYRGVAIRSPEEYLKRTLTWGGRERYTAERCITFPQSLEKIRQNADILYDDGKIVVFKKHEK
jgi:hypothetical protein